MRGNAALAEAQKENFLKWVSSVRMPGNDAEKKSSGGTGGCSCSGFRLRRSPLTSNKSTGRFPRVGNQHQPRECAMRAFTISGSNDEAADVSVSSLPGKRGRSGKCESLARASRFGTSGRCWFEIVDHSGGHRLAVRFSPWTWPDRNRGCLPAGRATRVRHGFSK